MAEVAAVAGKVGGGASAVETEGGGAGGGVRGPVKARPADETRDSNANNGRGPPRRAAATAAAGWGCRARAHADGGVLGVASAAEVSTCGGGWGVEAVPAAPGASGGGEVSVLAMGRAAGEV